MKSFNFEAEAYSKPANKLHAVLFLFLFRTVLDAGTLVLSYNKMNNIKIKTAHSRNIFTKLFSLGQSNA